MLPVDARDLVRDVFRHRMVLSYEALADGVSPDDLLSGVLEAVPLPDIPLRERGGASGSLPGAGAPATSPADGRQWPPGRR